MFVELTSFLFARSARRLGCYGALLATLMWPAPRVFSAENSAPPPEIPLTELLGRHIEISTGNHPLISHTPVIASVITAEEIKAMGATDLMQVLETVPGVHVGYFFNNYIPIYTHST